MLDLCFDRVDVAIVCSNFEESARFYRDLLELEVAMELDIPERLATGAGLAPRGFHHLRVRAGNTLIKLMDIEGAPERGTTDFAAGVRWLTFFVHDVQAVYDKLTAKGVPFVSPPVAADDCTAIVCAKDPDGVLIEFVQPFPEDIEGAS